MDNYIRTGLEILDKLLPRGIRRNSLVLLAGDSGTGKSLIAQLMLASRIQSGENVIYVCLDDYPDDIIGSLSSRGLNAAELVTRKRLVLVDAYAARYGIEASASAAERITSLDPHSLVAMLGRLVDSYIRPGNGMLIIDSLNPFIVKYEPTMVYDLVTMLRIAIAKKRNVTTLLTLHTPTQLYAEIAANMEHMVDVLILTRYHTEALEAGYAVRELLVKKAKGVPVTHGWVKFMITDEGVVEVQVKRRTSSTS